ncbi:MAG: TetR/AcrR family transcriptional regulator [Rhodocyclaceae bacterium]|nr:TetR/AcrR family transcriptional regulator [Rhodocyclaceae bacterium]MBX3671048.1 TetR/AcrR family transcriptional regulator [Rhodocyclaceae bacterium]
MEPIQRRRGSHARAAAGSAHERLAGRPSALDAREIHADILCAARAAFIDCGYAGAGIEQIARAGKVAKITVYRRFGGKQHLFEEVAAQALQSTHECFRCSLETGSGLRPALEHIVAKIDIWARDAALQDILRLVAREAQLFPALAARLQGELDHLIDGLNRQIASWQAQGCIHAGDTRLAARQLVTLAASCVDKLLQPAERVSAEKWQSAVVELLLQTWCPAYPA